MITPFDHLVYAAAEHHDHHIVYRNFLGLLKETPMPICQSRSWTPDDTAVLPVDDAKLWTMGNNVCVFAQSGINTVNEHVPVLLEGQQGLANELLPESLQWSVDMLMLFRDVRPVTPVKFSFDVIPIMSNVASSELVFPEMQIRFDAVDDGWVWYMSPTGFVNSYLYEPMVMQFPPASKVRLNDAIEHFGNEILYFLGAFNAHISQPGTWDKYPAKAARVKQRKGKIKKIYRIAQAGYQQYVPKE